MAFRRTAAVRQRNARRRLVNRRRMSRVNRTVYRRRKQRWLFRNPLIRQKCRTKLVYNTVLSLDPKPEQLGAGGSNTYVYSANGCFDPDVTGVGHQPMYFDNFAAVYGKYKVLWSKITITVLNSNVNTATYNGTGVTTTPNYVYKLFCFTDSTNGATDYPGYMNPILEEGSKNIKWRFVGPSLTGKMPKLVNYCAPHKLANRSKYDDTLEADTSSVPSQKAYYVIGITSADGVTDPPAVTLNIRIQYYCEFMDRKANQTEN